MSNLFQYDDKFLKVVVFLFFVFFGGLKSSFISSETDQTKVKQKDRPYEHLQKYDIVRVIQSYGSTEGFFFLVLK